MCSMYAVHPTATATATEPASATTQAAAKRHPVSLLASLFVVWENINHGYSRKCCLNVYLLQPEDRAHVISFASERFES